MEREKITVDEYREICQAFTSKLKEIEEKKQAELKENESLYMENALSIYNEGNSFEADLIEIRLRKTFKDDYCELDKLRDNVITNVNNVAVYTGEKGD